eukprot:scaffold105957_cov19-Tisochrysis_lutea.AAC.1
MEHSLLLCIPAHPANEASKKALKLPSIRDRGWERVYVCVCEREGKVPSTSKVTHLLHAHVPQGLNSATSPNKHRTLCKLRRASKQTNEIAFPPA